MRRPLSGTYRSNVGLRAPVWIQLLARAMTIFDQGKRALVAPAPAGSRRIERPPQERI